MNKWTVIFFAIAAIGFTACTEDEEGLGLENTIHYDGPNQTAPVLPAGDYEAAARFTSAELSDYVGRKLIEVNFFIANLPQNCTIRIYDEGDAGTPGNVLYSASVSNSLRPFSWNTHEIRNPIDITGEDLWIGVALTHTATQQSIGCDAGPAQTDGDWLYRDSDQLWSTYRQISGESINWNIRGRVTAE